MSTTLSVLSYFDAACFSYFSFTSAILAFFVSVAKPLSIRELVYEGIFLPKATRFP